MATRVRMLVPTTVGSLALPQNHIVTLADDALATSLISIGRAVAVADATTMLTLFATDRWVAYKYGTGTV